MDVILPISSTLNTKMVNTRCTMVVQVKAISLGASLHIYEALKVKNAKRNNNPLTQVHQFHVGQLPTLLHMIFRVQPS
jgi:hypothetical protein